MRNNGKCTLVKTYHVADTSIAIRIYILQSRYYVVLYDDGKERKAMRAYDKGFVDFPYEHDHKLHIFHPEVKKIWDKSEAIEKAGYLYNDLQEKYGGNKHK